jgi:hypothetical protein
VKVLHRVRLPDGLAVLGARVFSDCTALEEVILPPSLEVLGDGVFWNCAHLTTITIPPHCKRALRRFGDAVFYECPLLPADATAGWEVHLTPDHFKPYGAIIPAQEFKNRNDICSVTFPEEVEEIGLSAFDGCRSLRAVYGDSFGDRIVVARGRHLIARAGWG